MNLKFRESVLHATRLVRSGKLMDATEAIQRALRGRGSSAAYEAGADVEVEPDAIPGYARVIEVEPRDRVPGQFLRATFSNVAGTCHYKVYVPGRRGAQALPVVVMLHGCKQDADEFAAGTRMNALAEEQGFIVVYPTQSGAANGSQCWNWFQPKHQQRDRGEPSLIAGLTRQVLQTYGADAARVYIAGLSAGGAMAAVMGTTYPDVYAAVGIHSGLAYGSARDVSSAFAAMRGPAPKRRARAGKSPAQPDVPMIVFHGDNDTTVHPSNGDDLVSQRSTDTGGTAGVYGAHTAKVERGYTGGREYTRTTHADRGGRAVMEQWLIHGTAHAWSGGSAEGSYTDPAGPDASREMLRFFLQHRKLETQ